MFFTFSEQEKVRAVLEKVMINSGGEDPEVRSPYYYLFLMESCSFIEQAFCIQKIVHGL